MGICGSIKAIIIVIVDLFDYIRGQSFYEYFLSGIWEVRVLYNYAIQVTLIKRHPSTYSYQSFIRSDIN